MLGKAIAMIRDKAGMSQKDLADLVGVDRSTLSRWETGGTPIPTGRLATLAEHLGVSVDDLRELSRADENGDGSGRVVSRLDVCRWRDAVAVAPLSVEQKAVMGVLPTFWNERLSVATVNLERLSERSHIDLKIVDRVWGDILASDFVEDADPDVPFVLILKIPK